MLKANVVHCPNEVRSWARGDGPSAPPGLAGSCGGGAPTATRYGAVRTGWAAQAGAARRLHASVTRSWWPHRQEHAALTAGELMTAPAITVGPHVTIPAAARLMNTHRIRRLPVVDENGRLIGIVSRRDLLSVFLRPDEDIAADIRQVLDEILAAEPGEADVTVRNGIVTLTGWLDPKVGPHGDLIPLVIRLMWGVDGVVDIVDHLGEPQAEGMRRVQVTSGEQ